MRWKLPRVGVVALCVTIEGRNESWNFYPRVCEIMEVPSGVLFTPCERTQ